MKKCSCVTDDSIPRLNYMIDMYEKNIITVTLSKHNSVKEAAKTLDIHPSTLFRKIKKHNIKTDFIE
jgi:transcriptional regulator with PAS, ATPase and Fis domain